MKITHTKVSGMPSDGDPTKVQGPDWDADHTVNTTELKAALAITSSDVSGLSAVATSGSAGDLGSGTLPAARLPAFTGDVTTSAGAATTSIAANAVTTAKVNDDAITNAKLANMAAASIKGSVAGGDPADLTGTQAVTILDTFTTTLKGLTTPSGAAANVLRGDGSWSSIATLTAALNAFTTTLQGVVPASGASTSYLRGDATWKTPTQVTADLNTFTTTLKGLATASGAAANILRGDGSWSSPTALTAALDLFTSSLRGLTPASGGGTVNYLRADATWANPVRPTTFFGDGRDGSAVMDGVAAVPGFTLAGSTYTAQRTTCFVNLTVNVGITCKPDGWPILVQGTFTNNGDVNSNGTDASGITDGSPAFTGTRVLPPNSSIGNPSATAPQCFPTSTAANNGSVGTGAGGSGGNGGSGTVGRGGAGGGGGQNATNTASPAVVNSSPSVTQMAATSGDIAQYPNAWWIKTIGQNLWTHNTSGSAGGGTTGATGGGRGGAGGWMAIAAFQFAGSGTWRSKGGAGGAGQSGAPTGGGGAGGGGGGAGGFVALIVGVGSPPTFDVSGGSGGAGGPGNTGGGSGGNGGNGGNGYVQIT